MKAYIRTDPLIDERKGHYSPAQLGTYILVLCKAARQRHRGRFRSVQALRNTMPTAYVRYLPFLFDEGDVVELDDGSVVVDGWDEWQEGDQTVGERMSRLRNRKRNATVTPTVTPTVTQPLPAATYSYSDIDVSTYKESASALSFAREGLPHLSPRVQEAGEAITGQGILTAGDKQLTELDRLCEVHGDEKVIAAFRKIANGGQKSWRQLVWDSVKVIEPFATSKDTQHVDDAAADKERWRKSLAANKQRAKELGLA